MSATSIHTIQQIVDFTDFQYKDFIHLFSTSVNNILVQPIVENPERRHWALSMVH